MDNLTIRNATPSDAKSIATIHVLSQQCAFKGQLSDNYLDSLSIDQQSIIWQQTLEQPQQGVYQFVAQIPGEIVGWCMAGISRDPDRHPDVSEIYAIYVHPDHLTQGIGTALLKHSLAILKQDGYSKVTVWIPDFQAKTQKFYLKNNWCNEGITRPESNQGYKLPQTRYTSHL